MVPLPRQHRPQRRDRSQPLHQRTPYVLDQRLTLSADRVVRPIDDPDEVQLTGKLRKVALGVCTRDYGTPCQHEHACVRCPQLRPDPAQMPRLEEIHANLLDRLSEAQEQGWLGEVAAIEASIAAAGQKLTAMRQLATKHATVHLGMPDFRPDAGRSSPDS